MISPSSPTGVICLSPPKRLPIPAAMIISAGFSIGDSSEKFSHCKTRRDIPAGRVFVRGRSEKQGLLALAVEEVDAVLVQLERDLLAVGRDGVQLERRDDDNGVVAGGGEGADARSSPSFRTRPRARGCRRSSRARCAPGRMPSVMSGPDFTFVAEERGLLILGEVDPARRRPRRCSLSPSRFQSSASKKFICGVPMKPATKRFGGMVEHLLRRADLLDEAVAS